MKRRGERREERLYTMNRTGGTGEDNTQNTPAVHSKGSNHVSLTHSSIPPPPPPLPLPPSPLTLV